MTPKIDILELKKLVLSGNFAPAKEIVLQIEYETTADILLDIAIEIPSIAIYSFICSLLIHCENSNMHILALDLLLAPLSGYEGAYSAALYHARKALELDPLNVYRKQAVLFFHETPDQLIDKEEAIRLAEEILEQNPDNYLAQLIVSRYMS